MCRDTEALATLRLRKVWHVEIITRSAYKLQLEETLQSVKKNPCRTEKKGSKRRKEKTSSNLPSSSATNTAVKMRAAVGLINNRCGDKCHMKTQ